MATRTQAVCRNAHGPGRRISPLRERDFRWFFVGYATSLFGSSMAPVAVAFAVIGTGHGGTALGRVMAARILPVVLVLLVGGVVADRLGSRRVMLAADLLRAAVQAVFAALLLAGRAPLWAMVAVVGAWGVGEGFFLPALGALVPGLVRRHADLSDATTLLGLARSAAAVAGPATAGLVTAVWGPAAVLLADAASYAVCALALARLPPAPPRRGASGRAGAPAADLRRGWAEFRSRKWLWVTTAHMGLFNLLVWAPFLILGPLVSQHRFGGARGWGLVMALYGAGAVLGGLAMLGRRPRRPLAAATAATLGWALPSAALAARAPLVWTALAALLAGAGSAVCDSLYTATTQQRVPPGVRARISSFGAFGAFVLGPLGLAAAGPVAARAGTSAVLAFGALWQLAAAAAVLAVPSVRTLRSDAGPVRPAAAGDPAGAAAPAVGGERCPGGRRGADRQGA